MRVGEAARECSGPAPVAADRRATGRRRPAPRVALIATGLIAGALGPFGSTECRGVSAA
jgi:hypothetical protein